MNTINTINIINDIYDIKKLVYLIDNQYKIYILHSLLLAREIEDYLKRDKNV